MKDGACTSLPTEDGRYFRTLVVVDQFTREYPLLKADISLTGEKVAAALERVVQIRGNPQMITVDGSESINDGLSQFCKDEHVEFTRSRPYHKNDQAWVEQKNGSVVRHFSHPARHRRLRDPLGHDIASAIDDLVLVMRRPGTF